jgi:hypothetical protein
MNNAKFTLLIADVHRKDATRAQSDAWKNLVLNWRNALPANEEKYRLTENVWWIHLDNGLPVLAGLVQGMKDYQVPIRVLFFDESPAWIQHPPEAKPADESKPS